MLPLFAITLFLSSGLLFLIQPMVGKMLLPYLGGVPSVWNTCMVFFQALLLAGYGYTHFCSTRLRPTWQIPLHLTIMALPFLVLPIAIAPGFASGIPAGGFPILWILGLLFITTGLPFFVISTTAPMLQRWFSLTGHAAARDPYFLYAASNAGSILGLLAYPFVLERLTTVSGQGHVWHIGYGILCGLTMIGGAWTWIHLNKNAGRTAPLDASIENSIPTSTENAPKLPELAQDKPTHQRRFMWVLLSFIPSSMMLGLTTYISTDIASTPLLWVIPLAIYLLSFILVFARRPVFLPSWSGRAMCLLATTIAVAFITGVNHPILLLLAIHILFYFVATMLSHGRLARLRPAPQYLTEFYLFMSIGGALGGLFNALIAPLIFTRIIEYMLVIALACAVREKAPWEKTYDKGHRNFWPAALPTALMLLLIFAQQIFSLDFGRFDILIIFGPVALLTYSMVERPLRFALALVLLTFASGLYNSSYQHPIFHERNFYGSIKVADSLDNKFRYLIDGNTMHGRELLNTDQCLPLSYYHPAGPVGHLFALHNESNDPTLLTHKRTNNIALIGVGIGSLACYATPDQHWDLFEINPSVVAVASNPEYFTTIQRSAAASHEFIVGDARLRLQEQPDQRYDIIVIDAFSSDSIPAHLLTLEAIELYFDKLADGGVLAFNISNRVLDLEPVLARAAYASDVAILSIVDTILTQQEADSGKDPSHWIFLARNKENFAKLAQHPNAEQLALTPQERPWTDAFSNITQTIRSPF